MKKGENEGGGGTRRAVKRDEGREKKRSMTGAAWDQGGEAPGKSALNLPV